MIFVSEQIDALVARLVGLLRNVGIPCVARKKGWSAISTNNYERVAAVWASDKEAYRCQKWDLNMSPSLEIITMNDVSIFGNWTIGFTSEISMRIYKRSL